MWRTSTSPDRRHRALCGALALAGVLAAASMPAAAQPRGAPGREPAGAPAALEITRAEVAPAEAFVGDTLRVTAAVRSSGGPSGPFALILKLEGRELGRQAGEVGQDAERRFQFAQPAPDKVGRVCFELALQPERGARARVGPSQAACMTTRARVASPRAPEEPAAPRAVTPSAPGRVAPAPPDPLRRAPVALRLISSEVKGDSLELVIANPGEDQRDVPVELRLAGQVVGRGQLPRLRADDERRLVVAFALPPGTTGPVALEIYAGKDRIGVQRLEGPLARTAPAPGGPPGVPLKLGQLSKEQYEALPDDARIEAPGRGVLTRAELRALAEQKRQEALTESQARAGQARADLEAARARFLQEEKARREANNARARAEAARLQQEQSAKLAAIQREAAQLQARSKNASPAEQAEIDKRARELLEQLQELVEQ